MVYVQLAAAACFVLGIFTRSAGLLVAALSIALGVLLHSGDPLAAWTASCGIAAAALALAVGGPGAWSLSSLFNR